MRNALIPIKSLAYCVLLFTVLPCIGMAGTAGAVGLCTNNN